MVGKSNPSRHSPARRSSGSSGWFYEIEGTSHGPVDFKILRSLASSRKILAHHLIWKSGSDAKQQASTIVGLIPPEKKDPASAAPTEADNSDPYAPPRARTIADGPPGGLYLPHLHPANFPLHLTTLALPAGILYLCRGITDTNTLTFLIALAGLSLLCWISLSIIYLHRAWEMVRMFGGSLSGGKAIRFLFFPFFNALWCFVALYGWSKIWNHSVRTHPGLKRARKVWKPFFFLFPTLFLISQALVLMHLFIKEWPTDLLNPNHQISLGVWATTLLVTITCWGQIAASINFLARKKS